jgi:hypothetical protein
MDKFIGVLFGIIVVCLIVIIVDVVMRAKAKNGITLIVNKEPKLIISMLRENSTNLMWVEESGDGDFNIRRRAMPMGKGPVVSVLFKTQQHVTECNICLTKWWTRGPATIGSNGYSKVKSIAQLIGEYNLKA